MGGIPNSKISLTYKSQRKVKIKYLDAGAHAKLTYRLCSSVSVENTPSGRVVMLFLDKSLKANKKNR